MPKIMSNSKERLNEKAQCFFEDSSTVQEPAVAYRHDYTIEAHNVSEEYPFMTSCNNDEMDVLRLQLQLYLSYFQLYAAYKNKDIREKEFDAHFQCIKLFTFYLQQFILLQP